MSLAKLLAEDPAVKTALARADLKSRVQVHIDNPFSTPKFLAIPRAYFFQP